MGKGWGKKEENVHFQGTGSEHDDVRPLQRPLHEGLHVLLHLPQAQHLSRVEVLGAGPR